MTPIPPAAISNVANWSRRRRQKTRCSTGGCGGSIMSASIWQQNDTNMTASRYGPVESQALPLLCQRLSSEAHEAQCRHRTLTCRRENQFQQSSLRAFKDFTWRQVDIEQ